jgi:hypothetical protein
MENKNKMLFFFQDSKLEQVTSSSFILEVVCSLPFIVTVSIYKLILVTCHFIHVPYKLIQTFFLL